MAKKSKSQSKQSRKHRQLSEVQEIELLNAWIQSQKPDSGTNPLSIAPPPPNAPVGRIDAATYSPYAGCTKFDNLPISKKTKDALRQCKYVEMTDVQRASLPHSLCGRDILGAAKTGSGKTLAFVIPVLEKLYKERWSSEDGVGSIIISPTKELANQLFGVLKSVGKHHNFSAGLLIGGGMDVDVEKESVSKLNILVCTPGRLLQHMDETPNFDCSQLQILVLDEADRILDNKFKNDVNAILSQLPKYRQTLLFSATQTKSVQELLRLDMKDPEYVSVHDESVTATPNRLVQTAMVVPLEQKFDMLWSFVKAHLNSKILVFLSSCKQVKFAFEAFKKLRPGIPLKCLHGRMKQDRRLGIYTQFCEEERSVLFATDVAARGLDFNKAVDWVVQVDCPDDVASYIHRVGRTARYQSGGKSVLFLTPTEEKMLDKLKAAKVPVHLIKANTKRLQPISTLLAALLVKYPDMQYLAQRAFITYVRSIRVQKDKEVFDVMKLPIDEFSASMGLPMTPKIRFLSGKSKSNEVSGKGSVTKLDKSAEDNAIEVPIERPFIDFKEEKVDMNLLITKDTPDEEKEKAGDLNDVIPATRILKKKKLKINIHRPVGTRKVFDEEGNTLPPLARLADTNADGASVLDQEEKDKYYKKMREEMKLADKEDKQLDRQRRKEKRIKEKIKRKKASMEEEDEDGSSGSDEEATGERTHKRSKIYFDSDSDKEKEDKQDKSGVHADAISLAEQEALALKLLSSMH